VAKTETLAPAQKNGAGGEGRGHQDKEARWKGGKTRQERVSGTTKNEDSKKTGAEHWERRGRH